MIKPVQHIPKQQISNGALPEVDLNAMRVDLPKQTLQAYHDAMNPKLSFGMRLRRFLRAENEAGRIAKTIKDFALIFIPYGRKIETLSDFVTSRLEPQHKYNRGSDMNWIINRLKEKSTWRGIIAVATALGVSWSPDQIAAIVALGVAVAGAFEVFFKEPQSADSKK